MIHRIQLRVYYEDTDAGGIIYHANYLKFAERGRTEFMRAVGLEHHNVHAEHNLLLVVRHIEIDYRASGVLDDWLDVTTEVEACGSTSLTLKQAVKRGDTVLATMKVVVVAITGIGKAVRIPPQLRQIFAG